MPLALLMWACDGAEMNDQQPMASRVEVEEGTMCPECTISFTEIAVLGDSADPASVSEDAGAYDCTVGRLSGNRFVLSRPTRGGELLVYDSTGKVIHGVGHPGAGPGEFGRELQVEVIGNDSLFVVDLSQRRWTLLSPLGDVSVITPTLPDRIGSFGVTRDRHVAVQRVVARDSAIARVLEVRNLDGRLASEAGPTFVEWDLDPGPGFVSPGPHGLWIGTSNRLQVDLWSLDGQRVQTLYWTAEWFPPGVENDPGFPLTAPPAPILLHAWEDDEDQLWVYIGVPDAQWKPVTDPEEAYDVNAHTISRYFDTRVEVVDLHRAQVTARGTYPTLLRRICGDGAVYTTFYAPDGDMRMRVLSPVLSK